MCCLAQSAVSGCWNRSGFKQLPLAHHLPHQMVGTLLQGAHGRVFNFSAGPATLPVPVLEQTQADLINYRGSGMSVMEMSHRGPEFTRIIEEAEADLRQLMDIPDNYKVLFLQGGASQQFSAIPFNLTQPDDIVDHVSPYAFLPFRVERPAMQRKLMRSMNVEQKSRYTPNTVFWVHGVPAA